MKVRMKCSAAGPTIAWKIGDEVDLPEKEAKRYIERGLAEAVAKKRATKRETRAKSDDE